LRLIGAGLAMLAVSARLKPGPSTKIL